MRLLGLALDGVQNGALGLGVNCAQRIVEHENLRLPDERTRQRHPLLLPPRELHSTLPDHGVELLRERERLLENLRLAPLRRARGAAPRASRVVEGEADFRATVVEKRNASCCA